MDTVNICFHNLNNNFHQELEVPLGLTANELMVHRNYLLNIISVLFRIPNASSVLFPLRKTIGFSATR